jgi:PAS domain S-box-containing protein
MALNMSLSQKGLLLLAGPLILQLGVVASLISLQNQAEEEAQRADHARDISETAGRIVKRGLDAFALADAVVQPGAHDAQNQQLEDQTAAFYVDFNHLDTLVKDNPKNRTIANNARNAYLTTLKLIGEAHNCLSNSPQRTALFHDIRDAARRAKALFSLEREGKQIASESPERQARFREQTKTILLLESGLIVASIALIAIFFTRHIIGRLEIMIDNSRRLAAQKPLHEPLSGSDEITSLDRAFHDMARALAQATSEQEALTENARDLICSINSKGIFVNVSGASASVLGFTPDELTGSKLLNLIVADDPNSILKKLKTVAEGEQEHPCETRLRRKDGLVIDVLWSAKWSGDLMFCVAHDITERKQADRLRQEVVQMVSHDLRSPLLSIKGIIEMGQAGMIGELNQQGHKMFAIADRSSDRMLTLINDLLDVERLEAGMLELDKSQVALAQIFEQSLQTVANIATDKGVKLAARQTDLTVFADGDRLVQILVNLISNAVKFSQANTTVTLAAQIIPGFVKISVCDEGRGIPADQLQSIFDRFQQVQASDAKERHGTGLGLAICKALVGLHGGEISAQSEVGKGSIISFTLPKT